MSTPVSTAGGAQLRFRLPGSWWQVPLTDAATAQASIRRLVEHQAGNRDDQATERENMRRRFFAAAERAIEGNGRSMHVALEIVEDLPIPVSFTVYTPDLRLTPAIGTDGDAVIGILEQGLAARGGYNAEQTRRFSIGESSVLRVHHDEIMHRENPDEDIPALVTEYWISIPGTKRVALISFSTALSGIDEIMLGFFDSIIGATYWQLPEA